MTDIQTYWVMYNSNFLETFEILEIFLENI